MNRKDVLIYLLQNVKFEIATFGDDVGFVNFRDGALCPSLVLCRNYLKLNAFECFAYEDLLGINYNSETGNLTISLKQKTVIYKDLNL